MIQRFVDDEVIIEGDAAVGLRLGAVEYDWPSENAPSWWRAKLAALPQLGAQLQAAWHLFRQNPLLLASEQRQRALGEEFLATLIGWEDLILRQKAALTALFPAGATGLSPQKVTQHDLLQTRYQHTKAQYVRFAAPFYGNVYPLDVNTGLPIRPSGTEGVSGVEEMFGGPVSNALEAHEWDGIALGYALSTQEAARQGVEGFGAVQVGVVIIVVAVAAAVVGVGASLSAIAWAGAREKEAASQLLADTQQSTDFWRLVEQEGLTPQEAGVVVTQQTQAGTARREASRPDTPPDTWAKAEKLIGGIAVVGVLGLGIKAVGAFSKKGK